MLILEEVLGKAPSGTGAVSAEQLDGLAIDLKPSNKVKSSNERSSLKDRISTYFLNPIKRQIKAIRLARKINNLEIPYPAQQPADYEGSGVFSRINKHLGKSMPSRLAYALPVTAAIVQPLAGCATDGKTNSLEQITQITQVSPALRDMRLNNPLVKSVRGYVSSRYETQDNQAMVEYYNRLRNMGIPKEHIARLEHLNLYLKEKGVFLLTSTELYTPNPPLNPANFGELAKSLKARTIVKLFDIDNVDFFDGFVINGKKRNRVFDVNFQGRKRFLLGDELYSTHKNTGAFGKIVGLPTDNGQYEQMVAIPLRYATNLYGRLSEEAYRKAIEALTMHEVGGHLAFKTGSEFVAYVVQFGYSFDDGVTIKSPKDIAVHTMGKPDMKSEVARSHLEMIYYVTIDGKKVLRKNAPYHPNAGLPSHNEALNLIGDELWHLTQRVHSEDKKLPKYPIEIVKDKSGNDKVNPLISDYQLNASMAYLKEKYRFEKLLKGN